MPIQPGFEAVDSPISLLDMDPATEHSLLDTFLYTIPRSGNRGSALSCCRGEWLKICFGKYIESSQRAKSAFPEYITRKAHNALKTCFNGSFEGGLHIESLYVQLYFHPQHTIVPIGTYKAFKTLIASPSVRPGMVATGHVYRSRLH